MLLVTVLAIGVVLTLRAYLAFRSAAALRARRCVRMLRWIAEVNDFDPDDLARLLGVSPHQVRRWKSTGVPPNRQAVTEELLKATMAARREFPPQIARRLIALRARRAAERGQLEEYLADLSSRFPSHHIVVKTRR
jgi:hypothetical protein